MVQRYSRGKEHWQSLLFHNYTVFPSQEKFPRKMIIKYSFDYPPKERCRASWTSAVDIPAPAPRDVVWRRRGQG